MTLITVGADSSFSIVGQTLSAWPILSSKFDASKTRTVYLLLQSNPFGPITAFTTPNSNSNSSSGAPICERSKSIHLTSPFSRSITLRGVPTMNWWTSPWSNESSCILSRYWMAFTMDSSVALSGRSISPSRYSNNMARCSPWSLLLRGTFVSSGYSAVSDWVLPKNSGTAVQLDARNNL